MKVLTTHHIEYFYKRCLYPKTIEFIVDVEVYKNLSIHFKTPGPCNYTNYRKSPARLNNIDFIELYLHTILLQKRLLRGRS